MKHSFTHPFHIIQQYGYACKELEKRQARSFQVFFMKRRDLHIKFEASCTHEHMLHSLSHENFNHFYRSRSGVHYDFQTRRYSYIGNHKVVIACIWPIGAYHSQKLSLKLKSK